jgi:hypothetical protein
MVTLVLDRSRNERRFEFGRAIDEVLAQRSARPKLELDFYSRPEDRKRTTGSTSGVICRLNTQRATANPNAA